MPPKDDNNMATAGRMQPLQLAHFQSSPSSTAVSFVVEVQGKEASHRQLPATIPPSFLELDETLTEEEYRSKSPAHSQAERQEQQTLFRILPSTLAGPQQEVPVFLAFLNRLHSGDTAPSLQQPLVDSPILSSDREKSLKNNHGGRHVHFGDQQVYPILSRHDMTGHEVHCTWYTERYLKVMGQVQAKGGDEDKNGDANDSHDQQQHCRLYPSLRRDLILAACTIRRGRKAVLTEQARQLHSSPSSKSSKEERIREAYHRVALSCQREARDRGKAVANEVVRL
jgi:hypothetical protein